MGKDETDTGKTDPVTDPKDTDTGKGDAGTDDKGTGTESKKDDDPAAGLKSALEKERAKNAKLEKQARDAQLAKLPELERAQAEVQQLTAENTKLQTENTRMKLGMELELPWRLAKRISGDTEEDMRSDAADLLKDFKREQKSDDDKTKPPTNDGKKGGVSKARDMNALLRAAAGRS